MNPNDYLTAEQAKQDYPLIRAAAGRVLNPGNLAHKFQFVGGRHICVKCKQVWGVRKTYTELCSIPDPDHRPMPCIAEDLVRAVYETLGWCALKKQVCRFFGIPVSRNVWAKIAIETWWSSKPATKAAIALAALETTNTGGTT